jgi:uncharacterized protein (DUF934 family)
MSILVTDSGFADDDWSFGVFPAETATSLAADAPNALAIELDGGFDVARLSPVLDRIDMIRVSFATFSDGRGFSQARQLRMLGFAGRLRAAGHVLADQYAMCRRSGFDEVEIDAALAARQPEDQWLARVDHAPGYQQRLRQSD